MANLFQNRVASSVTTDGLQPATQVRITNMAMAVAGDEYSHSLVADLKYFIIRSRNRGIMKYSYTATESATNYVTVLAGAIKTLSHLEFTGKILYIQSSKNSDVLEIEEYY